MANEIKDKYSAAAAFTMTLASLASDSNSQIGRQSTLIDNSTNRYQSVMVFLSIKQGTSPTSGKGASVYLIRDDLHASPIRSDAAGTTDAALTQLNAKIIGRLRNKVSGAATGDLMVGEFRIDMPGPQWGIALAHDTGVALDSTEGNHLKHWIGIDPEIQ